MNTKMYTTSINYLEITSSYSSAYKYIPNEEKVNVSRPYSG
jgi:hypothetical protein